MSDFIWGICLGMMVGPLLERVFAPTAIMLWDRWNSRRGVITDGTNGTPRAGKEKKK